MAVENENKIYESKENIDKAQKSAVERDELHRAIWEIADGLRGSVDGWDFKAYVTGMMFYRYMSENFTNEVNRVEWKNGDQDFSYADMSDEAVEAADIDELKESMLQSKGFFLFPSELFCNVHKRAADDENINVTIESVFRHIVQSSVGYPGEENFRGLFDDFNVNSPKLGATVAERNKRLRLLMDGIANMALGEYKDNSIDAFGDSYEYLLQMYSSSAGKSGGEFYTPQEVSQLLMRLATYGKDSVGTVYDPACGSGALLLQAAKILGADNVGRFRGQEINLTTYNLCRMNMFLHDVGFEKFQIVNGDTLVSPANFGEANFTADAVVSNPPYSIHWEGDKNPTLINDPRFAVAGALAPRTKADLAFVMHCLSCLSESGTAAIVCFPGVMYRGGAEKKIRKYLVDNNYVDCVIQLPENLFYGTSIATNILVLKKNKQGNDILFIDATNECVKAANNNRLTDSNIQKIMDAYTSCDNIDNFAKKVSYDEISKNGYILAVSAYLNAEDARETVDIKALNKEIKEIVKKEQELREQIDAIVTELEGEAAEAA